MCKARLRFVVPIVVVILGISWLLDSLDVAPGINWVQTVGLATAGILILVIGGIDKATVVVGPFLMTKSVCTLLAHAGVLGQSREMPILVIVLGCLLLLVQILKLPTPGILGGQYWASANVRRRQ